MRIPLYQVDAFADRPFGGNPAAVCLLERWPAEGLLQAIAAENNLSETAFLVRRDDTFELRWLTPLAEVDLCGHATLAAAFVILDRLGFEGSAVRFHTRSGTLTVVDAGDGRLRMDFPARRAVPVAAPAALVRGLGEAPAEVLAADDYLAVFRSEARVRRLAPDPERLRELDRRGVVATAPGTATDFVARCFFPKLGVEEDPVTGSAHCELAPYWAARLGRTELISRQVSRREGTVHCGLRGDRVELTGSAVLYSEGTIVLPDGA